MKIINKLLKITLEIFFGILFTFSENKYSKDLLQTINLYKDNGFGKLFAKIRAWDAPYEEIEKLVPRSGNIYDLGSGDGLFGNYLAISSSKRKVTGIEIRESRATLSNKGIKNAYFKTGDVFNEKLANPACIIMFHLLHHIDPKSAQVNLIKNTSDYLEKGGKLIIVEIAGKPLLKYWFCWLVDAFVLPVLFDHRLYDFDFHYRKVGEWKRLLIKNNFTVKSKLIDAGMPFPHVIIDAMKE